MRRHWSDRVKYLDQPLFLGYILLPRKGCSWADLHNPEDAKRRAQLLVRTIWLWISDIALQHVDFYRPRRVAPLRRDLEKNILLVRRLKARYNENHGCSRRIKSANLHRLHFVEKLRARRIALQMRIGRRTIAKCLNGPAAKAARRDRVSKLDPFKPIIAELLQQDPGANAP